LNNKSQAVGEKVMKRLAIVLMIISLPISSYCGGFSKVGTAAAQFLKISAGARPMGMGETFVAVANDVSTLYWNPAGITNMDKISVGASHTQWFAEIFHNYAGMVIPLSESDGLGISVQSLSTNEQEVTTVEKPDGAGIYYSVNNVAIGISYARKLTDLFSVGVTAKYIQEDLFNESANTFALDIGTYLKTGFHNLVIAMCVSNFGGNMQLEGRDLIQLADINKNISGEYNPDARLKTEPYSLPLNFRVGVSMDLFGGSDPFFSSGEHRWTVALDGNHPNDNVERVNFGSEYSWDETVFARVGYKFNYDVENWTFGGGVKLNLGGQAVSVDYALVDYKDLGKVSRISLELGF
ncbi:MAG: PorV/PorQ family protein, partial [Ignavibacteriaceae bacterium]